MENIFEQIAERIIKEQELIIGPFAWEEAGKVAGLVVVNKTPGEIRIEGDSRTVLDNLVGRYDRLFGRASHEVSRDAASRLLSGLSSEQVPVSLQ